MKTTIKEEMPQLGGIRFESNVGCLTKIILSLLIIGILVNILPLLAGAFLATNGAIVVIIIAIVIAIPVICLLVAIYRKNKYNKWSVDTYPERMEQYKKDMDQYKKDMDQYKRDSEKYNAYVQMLKKELNDLKETYRKVKEMRDKYYQLNIIPQEYWNIVPVSMFYQYIKNGRTYSLVRNPNTSDMGAINMYEEEKDRKIIITQLSRINDSIRNYQSVLYEAIQDSQSQTERLASEIRSMNNNIAEGNRYSAINAYNSQQLVELQKRENDILYYGY